MEISKRFIANSDTLVEICQTNSTANSSIKLNITEAEKILSNTQKYSKY
jgi:hypothetical protein